jgi:hypothetical protein
VCAQEARRPREQHVARLQPGQRAGVLQQANTVASCPSGRKRSRPAWLHTPASFCVDMQADLKAVPVHVVEVQEGREERGGGCRGRPLQR